MLFEQGVDIKAYASFTEAGARASGTPVPTVSVYKNGIRIADDQNATHINDGTFSYTMLAVDNDADGSYVFSFFLTGSDQLVINIEHQVDNDRWGIIDDLYESMVGGVDNLYGKVFDMSDVLDDTKANTDTLLTNLATVDTNVDTLLVDVAEVDTELTVVDGNVDQIETTVNSIATVQGSIPVVPTTGPFGRVRYPRASL